MSRPARLALQIGLSVALIAAVLWQADLHKIGERAARLEPRRGSARRSAINIVATFVMVVRWHLLLVARGRREPGLWWLFETYVIALLLGQVLPTAVGGDAVRAIDLARRTGEPAEAVSSVVVDRVVGPRGARRAGRGRRARGRLRHRPRDGDRARTRRRRGHGAGRRRALLAAPPAAAAPPRPAGGSACASRRRCARSTARCTPIADIRPRSRGSSCSACWHRACARSRSASWPRAWDSDLSFATLLVLCPVLFLVTVVPVSLNGIGLREATFVVVLGGAGVSREDAFALGLAYFAVGRDHGRARRARAPAPQHHSRPRQDWRVPSSNVKSACAVSCSQPRRCARLRAWRFGLQRSLGPRRREARSPSPPRPGASPPLSRALARLGAPVTARAGSLLQVRDAPGAGRAASGACPACAESVRPRCPCPIR